MSTALKFFAEFFGGLVLVLAVVGSGMMAQSLTEDVALQLLMNAAATVAVLYILINLLAPLSGAHLNPVVTLVGSLRGEKGATEVTAYISAQILGSISGSLLAHLTFDIPFAISAKNRTGAHLLLAEVIATFGLVMIVFADWKRYRTRHRASMIALWIGGAYFFTSSTSFANPAVTIGRIFTDSFAGISPVSAAPFIAAQFAGAALAWLALHSIKTSLKERGKAH